MYFINLTTKITVMGFGNLLNFARDHLEIARRQSIPPLSILQRPILFLLLPLFSLLS